MGLKVLRNNLGILPLAEPRTTKSGLLIIPDQAIKRTKQGIVKFLGPEVKDVKLGMFVLFSGYEGQLLLISNTINDDQERLIVIPEDHVTAVLDPGNFSIPGLFFKDTDGEYFPAEYNVAYELLQEALENTEFKSKLYITDKQDPKENPPEDSAYNYDDDRDRPFRGSRGYFK